MTVSSITPATGRTTPKKETAHGNPAHELVATHALVPVGRVERIPLHRAVRPDASFVAHLIAMAEYTPQTRTLRRATPAAARATYDRATAKDAGGYGRVLSQIA
jgi:hypothetical protein